MSVDCLMLCFRGLVLCFSTSISIVLFAFLGLFADIAQFELLGWALAVKYFGRAARVRLCMHLG